MQYLGTVYLFLGVLPMAIVFWFIQRCREESSGKEPQKEKMLRPPGYSLRKRLEKLDERMWLAFMICMGTPGSVAAVVLGRTKPDPTEAVCFGVLILVLAGLGGVWLAKLVKEMRTVRLGMVGEQLTGQALNELLRFGCNVYHDFPTDYGNIDHVVVGPQGVWAVETKMKRKKGKSKTQKAHEVLAYGKELQFPNGSRNEEMWEQAERQAKWLARFLSSATGKAVQVRAALSLPGWCVYAKLPYQEMIYPPSLIASKIQEATRILDQEQITAISHQINQKVGDVEV